jgi:catechol 2,3-dioxygenase-like lactoylglutathione lyase family enzyme
MKAAAMTALLLASCGLAPGQGLTGYYDRQAALLGNGDGLRAAAQLKAEAATQQAKIQAIKARLEIEQSRLHRLESSRLSWLPWRHSQKRRLTARIAAETHAVPAETDKARALIERDRSRVMDLISRRLDQTIDEYAKLNGFVRITDAGARAANASLTSELIRRYDWKFHDSATSLPGVTPSPAPLRDGGVDGSVLDHLNLRVSDVERSARFYTSLFGGDALALQTSARPDYPVTTAILIHFGGRVPILYLSQASPEHPPGLDHLGIGLQNPSAVVQKVRVDGLSMEYPGSSIWLRDPAGTYLHDMTIAPWSKYQEVLGSNMRTDLENPAPLFRPDGIAAVTLRAPNPATAGAFWVRLFGSPAHSSARSFDFALSKTTIDLDDDLADTAQMTVEVPDLNARAAQRQLKSRGIPASRDRGGAVILRDPDGFAVKLLSAPKH